MIALYTAGAGQGKTAFLVDKVRALCRTGEVARVRICVPTGLQAQIWRERLAAVGGGLGVQVMSLDRLVGVILDQAGASYTEISPPVQFRLLRTICQEETGLRYYRPLIDKAGFIQVLQQRIGEFKAAGIEPDDLQRVWQAGGAPARLQELALIYQRYQKRLREEGWADRVGLHWLAKETLMANAAIGGDWPLLLIDGFDDFPDVYLSLWQLFAARVGELVMTLTVGGAVHFERYERTLRLVEERLGVTAEPLPATVTTAALPLQHLNRHLFGERVLYEGAVGSAVELLAAPDRVVEVRAALRWLKQKIVLTGYDVRQTALVARDMTAYRPFVQQIAAEMGIPIRFLDGLPLQQSPVMTALMTLLRLHLPPREAAVVEAGEEQGRLMRRDVISSWRSPYFRWQVGGEAQVRPQDGIRVDLVAREHQVVGGYDQWQAAFAACVGAEEKEDEVAWDTEDGPLLAVPKGVAAQALQTQFDYFYERTRPPAQATLRQYIAWLEKLIGPDPDTLRPEEALVDDSLQIVRQVRQVAATAEDDIAALRLLKDILRGMLWAAATMTRTAPIPYHTFFEELQGAVKSAQYNLPLKPQEPQLIVGNVTQLRGVILRAVAVMGLSEGSFPATIQEDPFLRDDDRAFLAQALAKDILPSTQSSEREFFYEAVTRPTAALLLTRPTLSDNGAAWVSSPFWDGVTGLLPVPVTVLGSGDYATLATAASPTEWWERAVTVPLMGADSVAAKADEGQWAQLVQAQTIWRERLKGEMSVWHGDLTAVSGDLRQKFGPEHVWSASRFEAYQKCGYFFWVQSVLSLAPRTEPEAGLSPTQLGSIYHDIFEEVYGRDGGPAWDDEGAEGWVAAVAQTVLAEAPTKLGFRATAWWPQSCAEIVENVWQSVQVLAQDEFEFQQAEAPFGGKDEPPLVLGTGEAALRLRGYIDRVDRNAAGEIRIIDYKLAGPANFKPQHFEEGKKLQLPLYAAAAEELLGLGKVVDGFYWHFKQAEASKFSLAAAAGGVPGAIQLAVQYALVARAQIQAGHFKATPPSGGCPSYCPAASFCWQYKKGWWG